MAIVHAVNADLPPGYRRGLVLAEQPNGPALLVEEHVWCVRMARCWSHAEAVQPGAVGG